MTTELTDTQKATNEQLSHLAQVIHPALRIHDIQLAYALVVFNPDGGVHYISNVESRDAVEHGLRVLLESWAPTPPTEAANDGAEHAG